MQIPQHILSFHDQHPLIGPIFWILSVQYYITQFVVSLAWARPYSWANNTISDLGNTACGLYGHNYVCSPDHNSMNASFIVLGIAMILGSLFIYPEFRRPQTNRLGFIGMAVAGFGTIMVGVFPENTIAALHVAGAFLPFFIGNLALISFGITLPVGRWLKIYSLISGMVALVALIFFITNHNLGLGHGGMERIVAYPQSIWLILFGIYMSRNHYLRKRNA